jgi:hypothetical protein
MLQPPYLSSDTGWSFPNKRRLAMKWITRSHVHVDRVACPWLISRFIDSEAEFLFAPKTQVLERAAKEGAIAFDTPGAELHHEDDLCTFDVIIRNFGLTDPGLLRMAKVVNAADTDRMDQDALAAGLEAIAVGYSLRFPEDLENLRRQFEVYDALYAWSRLDAAKTAG